MKKDKRDSMVENGFYTPIIFGCLIVILLSALKMKGQTPEQVFNECVKQGIQHPEIVAKQAILETGDLPDRRQARGQVGHPDRRQGRDCAGDTALSGRAALFPAMESLGQRVPGQCEASGVVGRHPRDPVLRPCRVCGGEVTQHHQIKRYDWICPVCNHEYLSDLRKASAKTEAELLTAELHDSKIANGILRLRVYDLERSFRLAKEAGIELPDHDDYDSSGSEYRRPERPRPQPVSDTDQAEGDNSEF